MSEAVDLELLLRRANGIYQGDATFTPDPGSVSSVLARGEVVGLDPSALIEHMLNPEAYGRALTAQLFTGARLSSAMVKARAYAQGAGRPLRLRLRLDPLDELLNTLRWETLRDPEDDSPLALKESLRLVRSLDSGDLANDTLPTRPALRAVIAVAAPTGIERFGLAPIDVQREMAHALHALGDIPAVLVGQISGASAYWASFDAILSQLRKDTSLLYLVCHGSHVDEKGYLWLESDGGVAERVPMDDFARAVADLGRRPLLTILVTCESGAGLTTVAPLLARFGISAVIGMQGPLSQVAALKGMPVLLSELLRDGEIDRAVAVARLAMRSTGQWWIPALWLGRQDGRLWRLEHSAAPPSSTFSKFAKSEPLPWNTQELSFSSLDMQPYEPTWTNRPQPDPEQAEPEQSMPPDDLSPPEVSAPNLWEEFQGLRAALDERDWCRADLATTQLLLRMTDGQRYLLSQRLGELPCEAIRKLDQLWSAASSGQFGLRAQQRVWLAAGGRPGQFDSKVFRIFGARVGWYIKGSWAQTYHKLGFEDGAPEGHLPTLRQPEADRQSNWLSSWHNCFQVLLTRSQACLAQDDR